MTITLENIAFTQTESLPDYEAVSRRFAEGFDAFVNQKKHQAVIQTLREELGDSALAHSENLIEAVMKNVDEEGLLEKRFIFISLNDNALLV